MDARAAMGVDVNNGSITDDDELLRNTLLAVEDAAIRLVNRAVMMGDVVIVTNAQQVWLDVVLKVYFTRLNSVLEGVPVVSARENFEHLSAAPMHWKSCCFQEQIFDHRFRFGEFPAAVVSIGDGCFEREATHHLRFHFQALTARNLVGPVSNCDGCGDINFISIKLIELPPPDLLVRELELLVLALPGVCPAWKSATGPAQTACVDEMKELIVEAVDLEMLTDTTRDTSSTNCECECVATGSSSTPSVTPQQYHPNMCLSDTIVECLASNLADLIGNGVTDIKLQTDFSLNQGTVEVDMKFASFGAYAV